MNSVTVVKTANIQFLPPLHTTDKRKGKKNPALICGFLSWHIRVQIEFHTIYDTVKVMRDPAEKKNSKSPLKTFHS